jgi:GAF domain-containing protein
VSGNGNGNGELYAAVAGEGEESLVGMRFPSSTGVAGWVLTTRQPIVVEDLGNDARFARDAAEATGYVPNALMAAPLLVEDRALGVLEVLDRPEQSHFSLQEMDLLGLFANQAAIAVDLLQKARRAERVLADEDDLSIVALLAASVNALEDERRAAGLRLLQNLAATLGRNSSS